MIEETPNPDALQAIQILVSIIRETRDFHACGNFRLDRYEALCSHPYALKLHPLIGAMNTHQLFYDLAE